MVVKDNWMGLEDGITDVTWGVCLPKNVLEHHPTVLCSKERNPACRCNEMFCRWWEYNRGHSWSVFRWLDQKEIVLHGRCDGMEGWPTGYIGGKLCKVHWGERLGDELAAGSVSKSRQLACQWEMAADYSLCLFVSRVCTDIRTCSDVGCLETLKRPTLTKSASCSSRDNRSDLVAPRDDGKSPRGQDWGPPGTLLRLYILHRGLAMYTLDQTICYVT